MLCPHLWVSTSVQAHLLASVKYSTCTDGFFFSAGVLVVSVQNIYINVPACLEHPRFQAIHL